MNPARLLHLALLASLAGCSAGAVTAPIAAPVTTSTATRDLLTAQQVVAEGQLVCQVGSTAFAMLDPSGAALLAKGAAKTAVDAACGTVGGVATALSNMTATPAGIVVQLPPAVTIPTKA